MSQLVKLTAAICYLRLVLLNLQVQYLHFMSFGLHLDGAMHCHSQMMNWHMCRT